MVSDKHRDLGLLILRVGIGAMFVTHGLPKLLGGPAKWETVGLAMRHLGIDFAPTLWGLMAACAETFGGVALAVGVAFRPACVLLAFTMAVATLKHLVEGDGLAKASHAIEAGVLFASLLLIGPGAWRVRLERGSASAKR